MEVSYKKKLSVSIYSPIKEFKESRRLKIEFLYGLYDPFKNHFLFFELISTDIVSNITLPFAKQLTRWNIFMYIH